MKAYYGKPIFSGGWDEGIDNFLGVYNTMTKMCEMTDEEKLKSLPIMLSGDALSYYSSHVDDCSNYEAGTDLLSKWYNSD